MILKSQNNPVYVLVFSVFCLYSAKNYTASPYATPGAFMIGDSLNMRHAVTGGGMTVGLSDVVLLRDLLRPILKHEVGSGINFPIY